MGSQEVQDSVELPEQIGKYRILSLLAQDSLSASYLASDSEDHHVVVEVNRGREEPPLEPWIQGGPLDHPNVVDLLETNPEFWVRPYLPGQSLRQLLLSGALPDLHQVALWTGQLASALDFAHRRHIVHGSLQPEFLWIDENYQILITDFGAHRPSRPHYLAPEVLSHEAASAASDLYCLALVVYELLTGVSPFRCESPARTVQRQAFDIPKPASQARQAYDPTQQLQRSPASVDEVLKAALEKEPSRRPASILEFGRAFQIALEPGEEGSAPLRADPVVVRPAWVEPTLPNHRSVWWWLVPAFTLALALWVNLAPRPVNLAEHDWLNEAVGWDAVPVGGSLQGALLWQGVEVALFPPTRSQRGPMRARAAANLLTSWLRSGKLISTDEIHGAMRGSEYVISGPEELLRIDGEMAASLVYTPPSLEGTAALAQPPVATPRPSAAPQREPQLVGEYWLALLRDIILLRQNKGPRFVRALEHDRPRRFPASPPRSQVLQHLREQLILLSQAGQLDEGSLVEAAASLKPEEKTLLLEAAQHVPLPPSGD